MPHSCQNGSSLVSSISAIKFCACVRITDTFTQRAWHGLQGTNSRLSREGPCTRSQIRPNTECGGGVKPLARGAIQIQPDPGSLCRPATSPLNIFTVLILNILTDLYLMSIPLPLLWSSSFSPLKKAGLTLLFSGGAFVICAGTARCVLILRHPVSGAQKSGSWAVRETFVAIVTANMPLVVPLVRRWAVVLWKVLVLWGVSLPGGSLSWGSRASSKSEEGGGNGNGNGNGKVRGRWQNGGDAGSSRPRSLLPLSVDWDVDGGEDLIEAVCLGRISVGTFAAMPEVHYGPVVGGLHGEVLRKTSYQFLDV